MWWNRMNQYFFISFIPSDCIGWFLPPLPLPFMLYIAALGMWSCPSRLVSVVGLMMCDGLIWQFRVCLHICIAHNVYYYYFVLWVGVWEVNCVCRILNPCFPIGSSRCWTPQEQSGPREKNIGDKVETSSIMCFNRSNVYFFPQTLLGVRAE